MAPSLAKLLAAAALPAASLALQDSSDDFKGFISFPVVGSTGGSVFGAHSKRQIDTDIVGKRSGTLYTINLTFGTPGQLVPVHVDTGSSELWVNPNCGKSNSPAFCQTQPRFTYSTTLVDTGSMGTISYGTGSASVVYVADHLGVGRKFHFLSNIYKHWAKKLTSGAFSCQDYAADLRRRIYQRIFHKRRSGSRP